MVHNGIIENFLILREELENEGYEFLSETDSETVAFLLERQLATTSNLTEATRLVCERLEGAFTLVVASADHPDVVVGARRNSPLVVGLGEGENFLGSDVAAFIRSVNTLLTISPSTGTKNV